MLKRKTFITLLVTGLALVALGVTMRIVIASQNGFCGSGSCGRPGQTLDLVYYIFAESGGQSTPLGVYLGTYAQTLQYCQTYHLFGSTLQCNDPADVSRGAGYGFLYLVYPGCGTGVCYLVPQIRLAIPEGGGTSWDWKTYKLTGASSTTGHSWEFDSSLGNVDLTVRTAVADFNEVPYLEPTP